jgi:hypothetical protein
MAVLNARMQARVEAILAECDPAQRRVVRVQPDLYY